MGAEGDDLMRAAQAAASAQVPPAQVPTLPDSWTGHPSDPLRFVKAEIRQLLLRRGALSIAQLPEEYLKFYRRPLTQALKMVDSQYTPESARGGKPSGRARKATLGAFLREHLTDAVEVRQRPHGQHEIVASGSSPDAPGLGNMNDDLFAQFDHPGVGFGGVNGGWSSGSNESSVASSEAALSRSGSDGAASAAEVLGGAWRRDTPEHRIRAYILLQQQQQQHQQRQLNELRDALQRVSVGRLDGIGGNASGASLGFASSRASPNAPLSRAMSNELSAPSPPMSGNSFHFPNDLSAEPLLNSRPVRDALTATRHAGDIDIDARFGADANVAAAVGALRGAALLSAATTDVPGENRIYVTWRVPSKATPLRVEDLWNHFSRFGALAFCNPRPLRHSHAPRRAPSLSGAGYAFLGFANPGGAEAAQRALARPSHAFRGAELRVKPWRERDEGTGSGDTPANVPASAVDAPPARSAGLGLGLGGGDVYFAHPESGAPTLAITSSGSGFVDAPHLGGLGHNTHGFSNGFNVNAARFDPKAFGASLSARAGSHAMSAFSLPSDLFGDFGEEKKPGVRNGPGDVFGANFFNLPGSTGGHGNGVGREGYVAEKPNPLRSAQSSPLDESTAGATRTGAAVGATGGPVTSRHSMEDPGRGTLWGTTRMSSQDDLTAYNAESSKSRLWSYTSEPASAF